MEEKIEARKVELAERLKSLLENYSELQQELESSIKANIELAKKKAKKSNLIAELDRILLLEDIDYKQGDFHINPYFIPQSAITQKQQQISEDNKLKEEDVSINLAETLSCLIDENASYGYVDKIYSLIEAKSYSHKASKNYLYEVASDLYDAQDVYNTMIALAENLKCIISDNHEILLSICYEYNSFINIIYCDFKNNKNKNKIKHLHIEKNKENKKNVTFEFLEGLLIHYNENVPYTQLHKGSNEDSIGARKAHVKAVRGNLLKDKKSKFLAIYLQDPKLDLVKKSFKILHKTDKKNNQRMFHQRYVLSAHKFMIPGYFFIQQQLGENILMFFNTATLKTEYHDFKYNNILCEACSKCFDLDSLITLNSDILQIK